MKSSNEKEKGVVIDEQLDKFVNQPLPEYKTDMAIRNMDSAITAAKELKERLQQEQGH